MTKNDFNAYVMDMMDLYDMNKKLINIYYNGVGGEPELSGVDIREAIEFVRTWDIIENELTTSDRNLYLAFMASGRHYQPLLEYLGKDVKKDGALRVMIFNIKNKIKKKYNERYDRDYL